MSIETEINHKPASTRTLIAFASYWGSKLGGINSFNADFITALGVAFHGHIRVLCVVLDAEVDDIQKAAKNHVEVLSLNRPQDSKFRDDLIKEVINTLQNSGCIPDPNSVWLGHDIITGDIAIKAANEMGGRSVLIHHMNYLHYEAYAEGAQSAELKDTRQRALFTQGDVVLAVGPVLRKALEDLIERENIPMLVPGLPEITTAKAPNTFTGFLSGRISADTHKLKQTHLGVAAFADATARANKKNSLVPEILNSSNNPRLRVRGLSEEKAITDNSSDSETDLNHFAEKYADGVLNLVALPFTTNRNDIFDELRRSSVALMPSWHEGFGLVAWEAIAAGVPLILSKKSGVYHLLSKLDDGIFESLVYPIDVRGQVDEPYFKHSDLQSVSDSIIEIAKDPNAARAKASRLREELLKKGYTWGNCAVQFVQALGWERPVTKDHSIPVLPVVTIPTHDSAKVDDLLDIPTPQWGPGKGLSDSQLLRAEEAIIPFDSNGLSFLNEQIKWAQDLEFPIALRLIVGVGGSGKTRLAMQLCNYLAGRDWWVGFLRHGKRFPYQFDEITAKIKENSQPSLIVIDYAESRKDDLLALLKPLIKAQFSSPLRVLLLARSGGEWWDRLEGADSECEALFAGRATSGPFAIPPLHDAQITRDTAFQQALTIFADKLSKLKPNHNPDLSAEYYRHPLLIQMAALLALHNEQTQSVEGLIRNLVNHERRYWGHLLENSPANEAQAAQLMALSTLSDGFQTAHEVEFIWKQAQCGTGSELKATFNHLRYLYPDRGGLQSLRPDLLGEALVAQVLLSLNGTAILNAVLGTSENRIRHHAWTVLARILRHRADIIPLIQTALVNHYLKYAKDAIEVCCQTPSPLPEIMVRAFNALTGSVKLQVAQQLSPVFLEDQLPLNDLALCVSETRLVQARKNCGKIFNKASIGDQANLAGVLVDTSIYLSRCGDYGRALTLAKEAEILFNFLAKVTPERFEPGWANSLNTYANCLSENGYNPEALESTKQALEIFERLANDKPELHDSNWAMSLLNYSIGLSENGLRAEALKPAKQALDIYERLAKGKPEHFESLWAGSLNTYSNRLSENGLHPEALATAKQALEIRERLAKDRPERFEPDWAGTLHNYAYRLSEKGLHPEALVIAKQALEIRERLAKGKPERFEPDWAGSLHNYASHLSDNGYSEEALATAKQALEIRERLAKGKPERFEPDWAGSLNNYANRLCEHGRYEVALIAAKHACEIYQRLIEKMPLKYAAYYRKAVLEKCFITWLHDAGRRIELTSEQHDITFGEHTNREWQGVYFFEQCVLTCLTMITSDQLKHAMRALEMWSKLDPAMQHSYEEFFFLLAATIEKFCAIQPLPATLSDWEVRYKAMEMRKQGHISEWLTTAAQRLGVALPE